MLGFYTRSYNHPCVVLETLSYVWFFCRAWMCDFLPRLIVFAVGDEGDCFGGRMGVVLVECGCV